MPLLLSITAVSARLLLTLPVVNSSRRAYEQKLAGNAVVHKEKEGERERERERERETDRGGKRAFEV